MVELRNESRCFFILAGRSSVSEGPSDANDLFDFPDVHFAMVDIVTYSCDGCQEGLVGGGVVSEGTAAWVFLSGVRMVGPLRGTVVTGGGTFS